jgi:hypothetical protein
MAEGVRVEHLAAGFQFLGTESDESPCRFLREALLSIKPEHAEVLMRVCLYGEPRNTVAESLNISVNALSVRLFRAKTAFRQRLIRRCRTECARDDRNCCAAKSAGPSSSTHRGAAAREAPQKLAGRSANLSACNENAPLSS